MLTNNSIANLKLKSISPLREIIAYEALWNEDKSSFKTLSELFAKNPGKKPSELISESRISEFEEEIKRFLFNGKAKYKTNVIINGTIDYPEKLKDAQEPVEVLYFTGNLDYLHSRSIAIVGTRKPSWQGLKRTEQLVKNLVEDDFTIVSGLATGIDTKAHTTAIKLKGRTIAVIGTPLDTVYPKENKSLQEEIAKNHLLISQVPFSRYSKQGINGNKLFFPERNKTMSAISEGTVIIEASETSGTLIQARAALKQGRKLFILESCFQNKEITWPERFLKLGAIRVKTYADIKSVMFDGKVNTNR